jgi:hypothetical protein
LAQCTRFIFELYLTWLLTPFKGLHDESKVHIEVFQHPKYVDIFLTCFKQFQNQNTFLIHRCSTKTILVFARKKTFEKSSVTLSIIPFLKDSQLIPLTLYIKIYKTDQRVVQFLLESIELFCIIFCILRLFS